MTYRAQCSRCGADVFRFNRLADEHIQAIVEHLWSAHPDVLRRPATLSPRPHGLTSNQPRADGVVRGFATAQRRWITAAHETAHGPNSIEWRDVSEPRLEGDGEALVRPLAVARCDILTSGLLPYRGPYALGHECVGEIVALGDAVRALEIGQRAVVAFQVSCGACASCAAGHAQNDDLRAVRTLPGWPSLVERVQTAAATAALATARGS